MKNDRRTRAMRLLLQMPKNDVFDEDAMEDDNPLTLLNSETTWRNEESRGNLNNKHEKFSLHF